MMRCSVTEDMSIWDESLNVVLANETRKGPPVIYLGTTEIRRDCYPLFATIQVHEAMKTGANFHLQEDFEYVPLFCNSPAPQLKDLTVIRRESPYVATAREKAFLELNEWEMPSDHGGYAPIIFRTALSAGLHRPDSFQFPRVEPLLRDTKIQSEKVRLTAGPIILGVQNLMIPMPANLLPRLGVACEIMQFLPALKLLVEREFMEIQPGDTIMCSILSAGVYTRIYLPITRQDDQHLESLAHFETAMTGLKFHAYLKGVTHLSTIRPPGCGFTLNWKHVVDYFDTCDAAQYLRFVISIGSRKKAADWIEDLEAAKTSRVRIPILDAYDPEDPMLEDTIIELKKELMGGRPFKPY